MFSHETSLCIYFEAVDTLLDRNTYTTAFDGHCGWLTDSVVSHSVLVPLLIATLCLPNNVLQITTKGKDRHYIILQGTADDDSCFIDVHVEWPGCVHDTRAFLFFSSSNLYCSESGRRTLFCSSYTCWSKKQKMFHLSCLVTQPTSSAGRGGKCVCFTELNHIHGQQCRVPCWTQTAAAQW